VNFFERENPLFTTLQYEGKFTRALLTYQIFSLCMCVYVYYGESCLFLYFTYIPSQHSSIRNMRPDMIRLCLNRRPLKSFGLRPLLQPGKQIAQSMINSLENTIKASNYYQRHSIPLNSIRNGAHSIISTMCIMQ
jgi:hypothetical protein